MMRKARALFVAALAILFSGVVSGLALAEETPPEVEGCLGAVGTFLTKNGVDDPATGDFSSRSLLSFTNGGHVFFTDSGEAGSASFQPFSDGRGAWRCVSGDNNKAVFKAVVIDFTFPSGDKTQQSIGRLEFDLTYDESTRTLTGSGALGFVPFHGNPMEPDQVTEVATFKLTGIRVDAPRQ